MEWLKQLKDQFLNIWKGLDNQMKILLGTLLFALIIGLVFLVNWASNPQYVPLYSNLSENDASNVVNWLKESGIDYELDAGGSKILVPQNNLHQTRLDIAGAGLTPRGGSIGFEIFDKTQLGMTDKERRIQYARAVSGELTRSIELLDSIEFAKVNISIPEQSLFLDEEKFATASVLVKIYPGRSLTQQNIAAITHMIAGGVEGLLPENVTIIDTNGNILSEAFSSLDSSIAQQTSNQFQAQAQYEEKIRRSLTQMMGKMYGGPSNVVITVSAQLNFDSKELVETIYEPVTGDEGIVRSEQKYEEKFEGTGGTSGGVPGSESNIPQYQAEDATDTNSTYSKNTNTINYEVNQRQVKQIIAPGAVENISVSVVINSDLSDTEIENLTKIVESAIGYNLSRGDQLTIYGMSFDNSLEEQAIAALGDRKADDKQKLINYGVGGLISFGILWIILRLARRSSKKVQEQNVRVSEDALELAAARELTPEEKARREMRKELTDLITKKPEDVAELLKTWLTDD
ncbi:MAG: flagellar M-ring protein FliF [Halanaerobiales bacterium]|nr:flagellar M-ring protein FliF [Halanaerobiales bacterium]